MNAVTVLSFSEVPVMIFARPLVFVTFVAQILNPEYTSAESEIHAMAVPVSTDTIFGPKS
jgi:hypothetical protein